MTEDEASECDSDSSVTNKRATPAGIESLGDESPSRMRTRNKPTQPGNNKRPKRGSELTDSQSDPPKTPNKTDNKKKQNKNDTPSKAKKRQNEDDCSNEEKDKRKRSDVSFRYKSILIY